MSIPDDDTLIFEKRDRKAYITFNRPAKRNAVTYAAFDRMMACVADAEPDDDIRVIVLQGAGLGGPVEEFDHRELELVPAAQHLETESVRPPARLAIGEHRQAGDRQGIAVIEAVVVGEEALGEVAPFVWEAPRQRHRSIKGYAHQYLRPSSMSSRIEGPPGSWAARCSRNASFSGEFERALGLATPSSRATGFPCLVIVIVSPRSTSSSRRGRCVLAS